MQFPIRKFQTLSYIALADEAFKLIYLDAAKIFNFLKSDEINNLYRDLIQLATPSNIVVMLIKRVNFVQLRRKRAHTLKRSQHFPS